MYHYITGSVKFIEEQWIVLDNQGMGYSLFTSANTIKQVFINKETTLFTHLYVREDQLTLYGFISRQELELFESLIKLSGVGPKAALSILSLGEVDHLKRAIVNEDSKYIAMASGIGKKTAEKIIIELKDKIKGDFLMPSKESIHTRQGQSYDAVMEVMASLGFSASEVRKAMQKIDSTDLSEEQIISQLLRKMEQ